MSGGAGAFFDVDGTIVASDIVRYGVEIRTAEKGRLARWLWLAAFLPRVPLYLVLDAIDRARFQRAFYRLYRGMEAEELRLRAEALFEHYVRPRIRPEALVRLARHADRGHRIVLVTGSVETIVRPLADHLGVRDVIAPRLAQADGRLTGELEEAPLAGERKAAAVAGFAKRHGLDPVRCHAYGDSRDDVPMLERVGRASVVKPDRRLRALAAERGWEILEWAEPEGA